MVSCARRGDEREKGVVSKLEGGVYGQVDAFLAGSGNWSLVRGRFEADRSKHSGPLILGLLKSSLLLSWHSSLSSPPRTTPSDTVVCLFASHLQLVVHALSGLFAQQSTVILAVHQCLRNLW